MEKYKALVAQAFSLSEKMLLPESLENIRVLRAGCEATLENSKFIKLPVVGLFNAGKTSLVNALVGQENLLPVEVVPETSIPCEIYPAGRGEAARVVVTRDGEKVYDGPAEGYRDFASRPGDLGCIYVESEFISTLYSRGIVLVDMPGSDSGIKEHNDAIIRYVENGTIFALLVSAKNGSLSAADMAFVKELDSYGLKLGVFLSKCDYLTAERLEEVKDYLRHQVEEFGSGDVAFGTLCSARGELDQFRNWVLSIDSAEISRKKAAPVVNGFIDEVLSALKTRRTLMADSSKFEDIDNEIAKLDEQLNEINSVLTGNIANADTPDKSTQDILDWVSTDIRKNSRLLAEAIYQNNVTQVNDTIMSIIRPSLLKAFAVERDQFTEALKAELDVVTERLLQSIDIPKDVIGEMIRDNSESLVGFLRVLADTLSNSSHPWVRAAGVVLSFIAEYVPDLLRSLFGGRERAISKLENAVTGTFTSSIVSSLRPTVLSLVKQQQEHILEATRAGYTARVEQIKEAMRKLQEQRARGEHDFTEAIKNIDNSIGQIEKLYVSI